MIKRGIFFIILYQNLCVFRSRIILLVFLSSYFLVEEKSVIFSILSQQKFQPHQPLADGINALLRGGTTEQRQNSAIVFDDAQGAHHSPGDDDRLSPHQAGHRVMDEGGVSIAMMTSLQHLTGVVGSVAPEHEDAGDRRSAQYNKICQWIESTEKPVGGYDAELADADTNIDYPDKHSPTLSLNKAPFEMLSASSNSQNKPHMLSVSVLGVAPSALGASVNSAVRTTPNVSEASGDSAVAGNKGEEPDRPLDDDGPLNEGELPSINAFKRVAHRMEAQRKLRMSLSAENGAPPPQLFAPGPSLLPEGVDMDRLRSQVSQSGWVPSPAPGLFTTLHVATACTCAIAALVHSVVKEEVEEEEARAQQQQSGSPDAQYEAEQQPDNASPMQAALASFTTIDQKRNAVVGDQKRGRVVEVQENASSSSRRASLARPQSCRVQFAAEGTEATDDDLSRSAFDVDALGSPTEQRASSPVGGKKKGPRTERISSNVRELIDFVNGGGPNNNNNNGGGGRFRRSILSSSKSNLSNSGVGDPFTTSASSPSPTRGRFKSIAMRRQSKGGAFLRLVRQVVATVRWRDVQLTSEFLWTEDEVPENRMIMVECRKRGIQVPRAFVDPLTEEIMSFPVHIGDGVYVDRATLSDLKRMTYARMCEEYPSVLKLDNLTALNAVLRLLETPLTRDPATNFELRRHIGDWRTALITQFQKDEKKERAREHRDAVENVKDIVFDVVATACIQATARRRSSVAPSSPLQTAPPSLDDRVQAEKATLVLHGIETEIQRTRDKIARLEEAKGHVLTRTNVLRRVKARITQDQSDPARGVVVARRPDTGTMETLKELDSLEVKLSVMSQEQTSLKSELDDLVARRERAKADVKTFKRKLVGFRRHSLDLRQKERLRYIHTLRSVYTIVMAMVGGGPSGLGKRDLARDLKACARFLSDAKTDTKQQQEDPNPWELLERLQVAMQRARARVEFPEPAQLPPDEIDIDDDARSDALDDEPDDGMGDVPPSPTDVTPPPSFVQRHLLQTEQVFVAPPPPPPRGALRTVIGVIPRPPPRDASMKRDSDWSLASSDAARLRKSARNRRLRPHGANPREPFWHFEPPDEFRATQSPSPRRRWGGGSTTKSRADNLAAVASPTVTVMPKEGKSSSNNSSANNQMAHPTSYEVAPLPAPERGLVPALSPPGTADPAMTRTLQRTTTMPLSSDPVTPRASTWGGGGGARHRGKANVAAQKNFSVMKKQGAGFVALRTHTADVVVRLPSITNTLLTAPPATAPQYQRHIKSATTTQKSR